MNMLPVVQQYATLKATHEVKKEIMKHVAGEEKIFTILMDYVNEYSGAHVVAVWTSSGYVNEVAIEILSYIEKDKIEMVRDKFVHMISKNIILYDSVILNNVMVASRSDIISHLKYVRDRTEYQYEFFNWSSRRVPLHRVVRKLNCMIHLLKKAHTIQYEVDYDGDWLISIDGHKDFHLNLCVDEDHFIHLNLLPPYSEIAL